MKKLLLLLTFLITFFNYAQFSQSFEGATTIPAGWSVINGGDANTWAGINLGGSYTLHAQNGTNTFGIAYGATAHDDFLVTPQFTIAAGINDKLSFWGRSRDATYPETISVKLSTTTATAAAFTLTLLATVAPISGTTFFKYSVDLAPYIGSSVYVGFRSTTTDQFYFDIDNVVVSGTPFCNEPLGTLTFTDLTTPTPTINWNAPTTPATYFVYVSTSGTVPTGPPTYTVNSGTSLTLFGLIDNTKYYVYVQSNCGLSSSVLGSLGVLNYVEPKIPPYNFGFDGITALESVGWANGSPNRWSLGTVSANAQSPTQYLFSSNSTAGVTNTWLYSLPLQLTSGIQYQISYYAKISLATASPQTLKVSVGNAQNPAAQSTVLQTQIISNATYTQYTTTFTPTISGVYYVGLRNNSAVATSISELRLDTFRVIESPLAANNTFLNNSFSILPNPADKFINVSNTDNINISEINITDLNGRIVKSQKVSNVTNIEINVADLTSGMYLMNINTEKGIVTKKIMKN